jgi:hypothetical protein
MSVPWVRTVIAAPPHLGILFCEDEDVASAQGRGLAGSVEIPVVVAEQVSAEADGAAGSRLKRQSWCRRRRGRIGAASFPTFS